MWIHEVLLRLIYVFSFSLIDVFSFKKRCHILLWYHLLLGYVWFFLFNTDTVYLLLATELVQIFNLQIKLCFPVLSRFFVFKTVKQISATVSMFSPSAELLSCCHYDRAFFSFAVRVELCVALFFHTMSFFVSVFFISHFLHS